ncbi:hypothetical protein M0812_12638 [Anaeramoeba flamelloides]|uniref:Uncharacterized protein n=1 Tax=Anaeramoeba flamelloides TaxID=1746091 RepID=A0AAV7ZQ07_9EUKA|nr:hypothetical protein M0812_12638 [Anaeramoeba flamelloides]
MSQSKESTLVRRPSRRSLSFSNTDNDTLNVLNPNSPRKSQNKNKYDFSEFENGLNYLGTNKGQKDGTNFDEIKRLNNEIAEKEEEVEKMGKNQQKLKNIAEELLNENEHMRKKVDKYEQLAEINEMENETLRNQQKELIEKNCNLIDERDNVFYLLDQKKKKIEFYKKEMEKYEEAVERQEEQISQFKEKIIDTGRHKQTLNERDEYEQMNKEFRMEIKRMRKVNSKLSEENVKLRIKNEELIVENNKNKLFVDQNFDLKDIISKKKFEISKLKEQVLKIGKDSYSKEKYETLYLNYETEKKRRIRSENDLKTLRETLKKNTKNEKKLRKEINELNLVIDQMRVKSATNVENNSSFLNEELRLVNLENQAQTLKMQLQEYTGRLQEKENELKKLHVNYQETQDALNQSNSKQYKFSEKILKLNEQLKVQKLNSLKLQQAIDNSKEAINGKRKLIEKLRNGAIEKESQIRELNSKNEKLNSKNKSIKSKRSIEQETIKNLRNKYKQINENFEKQIKDLQMENKEKNNKLLKKNSQLELLINEKNNELIQLKNEFEKMELLNNSENKDNTSNNDSTKGEEGDELKDQDLEVELKINRLIMENQKLLELTEGKSLKIGRLQSLLDIKEKKIKKKEEQFSKKIDKMANKKNDKISNLNKKLNEMNDRYLKLENSFNEKQSSWKLKSKRLDQLEKQELQFIEQSRSKELELTQSLLNLEKNKEESEKFNEKNNNENNNNELTELNENSIVNDESSFSIEKYKQLKLKYEKGKKLLEITDKKFRKIEFEFERLNLANEKLEQQRNQFANQFLKLRKKVLLQEVNVRNIRELNEQANFDLREKEIQIHKFENLNENLKKALSKKKKEIQLMEQQLSKFKKRDKRWQIENIKLDTLLQEKSELIKDYKNDIQNLQRLINTMKNDQKNIKKTTIINHHNHNHQNHQINGNGNGNGNEELSNHSKEEEKENQMKDNGKENNIASQEKGNRKGIGKGKGNGDELKNGNEKEEEKENGDEAKNDKVNDQEKGKAFKFDSQMIHTKPMDFTQIKPEINSQLPDFKQEDFQTNLLKEQKIKNSNLVLKEKIPIATKIKKLKIKKNKEQLKQSQNKINEITNTFDIILKNKFYLEMFYFLVDRIEKANQRYVNPSIPITENENEIEQLYKKIVERSNLKLDDIQQDIKEFEKRIGMEKKNNFIIKLILEQTHLMKMINFLSLKSYQPVFKKIRRANRRFQKQQKEFLIKQKQQCQQNKIKKKNNLKKNNNNNTNNNAKNKNIRKRRISFFSKN